MNLVKHWHDLECIQTQQATIEVKFHDALQALITNERNATSPWAHVRLSAAQLSQRIASSNPGAASLAPLSVHFITFDEFFELLEDL